MFRLSSFRLIPEIDKNPKIVQYGQTAVGKIIILSVFAGGLYLKRENLWLQITAILAVMTFLPQYRKKLLVVATLGWLGGTTFWLSGYSWFPWRLLENFNGGKALDSPYFKAIILVAVLLFCGIFSYLSKVKPPRLFMSRPVLSLHVIYFLLLAMASYGPFTNNQLVYLWGFLIVLGNYFWFLSYTLLDRSSKQTQPFAIQLGHYIPFWSGYSTTPFPKGSAYLRRIEAKSAEQLAITQLKGIKLLYWALILMVLRVICKQTLYGQSLGYDIPDFLSYTVDLPSFNSAFRACLAGKAYSWYLNWLVLIASFLMKLLYLSIWGHLIIAICRMAGFRALRNTYKPLTATSLVDFWNRYYFYFKELLVENYFYPAFLRYFKKKPKMRLFFATLAAAGFGNFLFHFLRDIRYIMTLGVLEALLAYHVYFFYGLVLGCAIGISQIFEKKKKKKNQGLSRRMAKSFLIIGFYCILSIFDDPDRNLILTDHFSFLLSLFGIG